MFGHISILSSPSFFLLFYLSFDAQLSSICVFGVPMIVVTKIEFIHFSLFLYFIIIFKRSAFLFLTSSHAIRVAIVVCVCVC